MITSIHRKILDEVQNALSFQLRENTWSLRFLYYKFPVFWEENLKSTSIESSLGVNLRFLSRTTRQKQAIANLCCECHCGQKLTEDPKFVVIKMTSYSLKFFSKIWTKLDKTDVNFYRPYISHPSSYDQIHFGCNPSLTGRNMVAYLM